jgi:CelD/BcsL family acetyltransferase involved in cellulose biosynthesis
MSRVCGAAPFLARAWAEPWIAAGRARGTPVAIAVRDGERLDALLVVLVRRVGLVRVAEPAGTGHPSYLGLLVDPARADAIELVARECASGRAFDVLRIDDVSSADAATEALLAALAANGLRVVRRRRNPCLAIALRRPFDEFLRSRHSGKTIKNLRREERRLLERGDVALVHLVGSDVTPDAIRRAASVQEASWMARRGAAVLAGGFHRSLALSAASGGLAHLWIVTIGGEDAAFGFALASQRRIDFVWTAFRLPYEPLSVGKTLVQWIVRDACAEGFETFDFGHGDAAYKRAWATGEHSVERVAAGRGALAGVYVASCAILWDLARIAWLRSAREGLRRALRFGRKRGLEPKFGASAAIL